MKTTKIIVILTGIFLSIPSRRAYPVELTEKLFKIKKVKIVDAHHVYLRSDNYVLDHRTKDAGIRVDRSYIEAETGKIKEDPHARRADEITLKAGESCFVGINGSVLKLIKVKKDEAIFNESVFLRSGKEQQRQVRIRSYGE